MATESAAPHPDATPAARHAPRRRVSSGFDPLTAALLSLAAFLVVLAMLAAELPAGRDPAASRQVTVLRKIYQTTVVETVSGPGAAGASSVTQSVSNPAPGAIASAPATTRTS